MRSTCSPVRAILVAWFLFKALPFLLMFGVPIAFYVAGHRS
jgi:hypothetical protein